MATQKENYVISLLDLAKNIANEAMDKGPDLTSQYFDLGYNSGGGDEIVDGDLTNFNGLTAAEVSGVITALQQLANYFDNAAVTTGDYAVSYNNVRYVVFG